MSVILFDHRQHQRCSISSEKMLPYATISDAESAMGRSLSFLETLWFRYSARMPDYLLYYHNILFLFLIFTLAPLPLALLELRGVKFLNKYKIQPKSRVPPSSVLECYKSVLKVFVFVIGPLQLSSYQTIKVSFMIVGLWFACWILN